MGEIDVQFSSEFVEIGELARGGMGTAHLVFRRGNPETLFVLKRLRRGLLGDPEALRRFRHETTLSRSVQHPHIVRTIGAGTDELGPYLVLEYIHGTHLMDLSDRALLKRRRLRWQAVVGVGVQAAVGLEALHEAKDGQGASLEILHRDVSPHNVLVEHTGRVVLSDFGISKSRLSTVSTDASHMLGKLAYMAPEYLRHANSSAAGDVYSIGVTLWVALTGQLPFRRGSETQLLAAIIADGVPPVTTLRPDVPRRLSELLSEVTSMDFERRPTAKQVHVALSEICGREGLGEKPADLVVSEVDRLAGSDLAIRRQVFAQQARQLHDACRGN